MKFLDILLCTTALFLPAVLHVPEALAEQVKFVTLNTTGKPPLNTKEKTGFMDVVASEAFKRIGISLRTVQLPAERGLKNANLGIEDGEMSRIAGLEKLYPNLIAVPEKIMDWHFVGFSLNPISLAHGWSDLKPYTVSFINGWKILETNTTAMTVTKVRNSEQLFKLLTNKRIDVILYERWGGLLMRKNLSENQIRLLEPPLAIKPMYIYLHKKHHLLIEPLAKALKDMKNDGSYVRITNELLTPLTDPTN